MVTAKTTSAAIEMVVINDDPTFVQRPPSITLH